MPNCLIMFREAYLISADAQWMHQHVGSVESIGVS
jgi:hypothetical protein